MWLTLIERPTDARALDVLALRCGLFAAEALDGLAAGSIQVKWPNDLYVGDRKLAGVLIETRWRGTAPEWVAIGFGINIVAPNVHTSIGLGTGVTRLEVLDVLVPALRQAAASSRHLSDAELRRWCDRDISVGRSVVEPAVGVVEGVTAQGELLVAASGNVSRHRSGSLTFATAP